ncbi:hypothetical protein N7488_005966 [Penicillium malachiteum]|nr:hypothetical protein N7488_005966 [Penicillium malachiteum]
MDAAAYLKRHGWDGPGNPLNKNSRPGPHGGLGLTRPILVARKQNNHGVGKKVTKDSATNQWWLRGFEDALKGVGEEAPAAKPASNALTSELYRFFVRGEGLAGTLDVKKDVKEEKSKSKTSKSKRKRDDDEEDERKAKKAEKAARKEEKSKRRKISESADGGEILKSKKIKRSVDEEDYPTPVSMEEETEVDSTEDSKSKKEKKEKKSSKKSKDSDDADSKVKKDKKEKKEKKSKST